MTEAVDHRAVRFIFLFSLNNSGTTVMARYLAQQTGGYLPPYGNNEGQMAPAVWRQMSHAWDDPARPLDWRFIRREWERLARRAGKDLFIEASPPDFLRADAIFETFGPDMRAVFSAASPYFFVASVLYNYANPPLSRKAVQDAARRWQRRARFMRQAVEAHPGIGRISYEDFCAAPEVLNRALGIETRPLGTIIGKANERTRGIEDQTRRQLAFLTAQEWDWANAVLAKDPELVAFFGYELQSGAALLAEAGRDPAQAEAGRARRDGWAPRWRRLGIGQVIDRLSLRAQAQLMRFTRRP
ncbi:hypothetical protein [Sinisalibacter aestuarii]|uniref:Sulfotransferase family protein n=1 Tax=Sinisalibacter aestuarii TaxID=2949426 RepID=A0ABQ5LVN2_9RHOB|nr:hypothetical protein [Sinisalibacter aestuarii]GKY89045.1 hypothetical protein STA1M1_29140 [Sinisalibacter aestuarii]